MKTCHEQIADNIMVNILKVICLTNFVHGNRNMQKLVKALMETP